MLIQRKAGKREKKKRYLYIVGCWEGVNSSFYIPFFSSPQGTEKPWHCRRRKRRRGKIRIESCVWFVCNSRQKHSKGNGQMEKTPESLEGQSETWGEAEKKKRSGSQEEMRAERMGGGRVSPVCSLRHRPPPSPPPVTITLDYTPRFPPRGFHVRTLLLCSLCPCCRIPSYGWWDAGSCAENAKISFIHNIHSFIHSSLRPASAALRVTGGCWSLSLLSSSCTLDKSAVYCFSINKVKQLFALEFTLMGSQFASHTCFEIVGRGSNRTGAASSVWSMLRCGQSSITGGMCEVITQPNMERRTACWRTSPLPQRGRGDSTQKRAEGSTWQPGWLKVSSVEITLVHLSSLASGKQVEIV